MMCPALRVSAAQVQRFPLDQLASLFGGKIYKLSTRNLHSWQLGGSRAAALMRNLYPMMSPRRQDQIATALWEWMQKPMAHAEKQACIHGHPFDEKNTYRYGNHRQCKACSAARMRRYYQMAKSA